MASELVDLLDDDVGRVERGIHVALVDLLPKRQIVAELGVDHGRRIVERRLLVGRHGELLPRDVDQLGGILGLGA